MTKATPRQQTLAEIAKCLRDISDALKDNVSMHRVQHLVNEDLKKRLAKVERRLEGEI